VSTVAEPPRGRTQPREDLDYKDLLDVFPAAVYVTDADGTITFFNRAAESLAGRTPELGRDKWCVVWRLHRADGEPLPLDKCPMAVALRTGRPVRGVELIAERPNGERVPVMPFPTPLFSPDGKLTGAVNMIIDISDLKRAEATAARRAEEQAALYRFTDRLYRADDEQDIHEAGLDAILAALRCSRASILLFDDEGVMQFVASRGLSAAYCEAVTGHTPWTPGEPQPEPIFIPDIAQADLEDDLKATIARENIAALAFIPLVAHGGVIGKFMAYYDAPRQLDAEQTELALTIARQLGFGIERERAKRFRELAEQRQHRSDSEFRTLADNIHQFAWMTDATGWIYWYNQRWFDYTGATLDEMQGWGWTKVHHPDHVERVVSSFSRAVETGLPWEDTFPLRGKDGQYRWFLSRALPIRDAAGAVLRWFGTNTDITERLQAEEQRTVLINELNHRVKNTLATVQSVAMQTLRNAEQSGDALGLFNARLATLARAHDLLTQENWRGAELHHVIDQAMAPFRTTEQVKSGGPEVRLSPKQALTLSVVLHELATNAIKYGALSRSSGRVDISWRVQEGALHLVWRESGGPAVAKPSRTGFGTRLIQRSFTHDLGGEAKLDYLPGGVAAQCTIPLEAGADHDGQGSAESPHRRG
jgi:PAS domain S-box-containing protein